MLTMRLVSPYFTTLRTIPLVLCNCTYKNTFICKVKFSYMWESIARLVLKFRLFWLVALLSFTGYMAFRASRVKLSYDFNSAIPTDKTKYKAYQEFRKQFGEDGNLLVIGVQTDKLFQLPVFTDYIAMTEALKRVPGVDDVLGVSSAVNLIRDTVAERMKAMPI